MKFFDELVYAIRLLRTSPSGLMVATLILSAGIGVNCTIFTLVDNVSFTRPAGKYADQVFLVGAQHRNSEEKYFTEIDAGLANELARSVGSFETLSRVSQSWVSVSGLETPLRIQALLVEGPFLESIGFETVAGWAFLRENSTSLDIPSAVITRETWMRGWGGSDHAMGSIVNLNGKPHRIVGVAPDAFSFERRKFGIIVVSDFQDPTIAYVFMAGRLKDGVTAGEANLELASLEARVKAGSRFPDFLDRNTFAVKLLNVRDDSFFQQQIYNLLLVGLFILLVAAANVANLTLARMSQRSVDYAMRTALGASRWDLFRLSICENGLIALVSCVGGVGLAHVLVLITRSEFAGASWGFLEVLDSDVSLNGRVIAYTMGACIVTLLVIALSTFFFSSRRSIGSLVRGSSRSMTAGRAFSRATGAFLFLIISFTCTLLIVGVFFMRSLHGIDSYNYGYDVDGLIRGNLNLPFYNLPNGGSDTRLMLMLDEVLQKIRLVQGVDTASFAKLEFPDEGSYWWVKTRNTPPDLDVVDLPQAWRGIVYPGFFEVVGMKLIQGETFRDIHNTDGGEDVVIVNQAFQTEHFPGTSAVGEYLEASVLEQERKYRIIGVVNSLHRWWRDDEVEPGTYFVNAVDRDARFWNYIYIRSFEWNSRIEQNVRDAITSVDREIVIAPFAGLRECLDEADGSFRFIVFAQALAGGIGIVLSCAGIFSVVSYSIAQRKREMGVRLALGASPARLRTQIFARCGAILFPAILSGVGVAYVILVPLSLFSDQLYLVNTGDFRIYASASIVLLAAGLAATLRPALRAGRIDPNVALREV